MHLASDYIHPTPRGGRCRIRIYLPDEERDVVVVICTELPNNPGASVTNAIRRIAAEVIQSHRLPTPLVWIEHHPPETTDGRSEIFEMVLFDSYEIRESRAPYLGDQAVEIGSPSWKALDLATVEMLVGEAAVDAEHVLVVLRNECEVATLREISRWPHRGSCSRPRACRRLRMD